MRENRHNHNHHNNHNRPQSHHSEAVSELSRKEQDHRHQWQDKYLKSNNLSFRMGLIFGVIYNLALLFLTHDLIKEGEKELAMKIFFGNIGLIAFALLVTSIERKVMSRKPPRRGRGNDRRFNNKNRGRGGRGRDDRRHDERRDDRRREERE